MIEPSLAEQDIWVVGGRNIDEDLHFSSFYLESSVNNDAGIYKYDEIYAHYKNFNEVYYVKKDVAIDVARELLHSIMNSPDYMNHIDRNINETSNRIKSFVQRNKDFIKNFKAYSFDEVFKIYCEHNDLTKELYQYARIPQALDRGANFFTNYLVDYLKDLFPNEYIRIFSILTTPKEPTEVAKADFELGDIVKSLRASEIATKVFHNFPGKEYFFLETQYIQKIEEYINKWSHLYYHGYRQRKQITIHDIIDQIRNDVLSNDFVDPYDLWSQRLYELLPQEHQYDARISSSHKYLFDLYAGIGVLKMFRKSAQIMNFMLLDKIFEYVSKALGVEESVFRFMTHDEFSNVIKHKKAPNDLSLYRERAVACLVHMTSGKTQIIVDKDEITRRLSLLESKANPSKKFLEGTTASLGNVRGRARVVHGSSDNFQEGDILVGESIDPDIVHLMKKSKAIVTEEGGVTSHACVLARELRKPCIVGVSGLLSHVRDGDILELLGDKGTIRILLSKDEKLFKNIVDVNAQEIESFGGKALGLYFLFSSGFQEYLPKTFLGSYRVDYILDNVELLKLHLKDILSEFGHKIAVRSSALLEDSQHQSWAGQYSTFLNVPTNMDDVILKIMQVYQNRIKSDYMTGETVMSEMGIILQQQVEARFSGICFTMDVVGGYTDIIIIEVIQGLGQALTDGKTIPMKLQLKKEYLEIQFMDKNIDSVVLSTLLKVAKLAIEVEKKGHNFFDIEFALDRNLRIYILQARPISNPAK